MAVSDSFRRTDSQSRTRRVLYVLNGTMGGAGRSALQLIERLPNDRYEACVVYPTGLGGLPASFEGRCVHIGSVPLCSWQWYRDVPFRQIPRTWIGSLARLRKHLISARQIADLCVAWGIDIVHTNSSTTLAAALAAQELRLPHVWHIRELIGPDAPFRFPPNDRLAARLFARLSNRLVANSRQSADFFREFVDEDCVSVVPNGIPLPPDDLVDRGRALRQSLSIPSDACVVAMVANLSSTMKGHELFFEAGIEAARRRPAVWLALFGAVPAVTVIERVRQMAAEAGLGSRVVLAGYIDDPWSIMSALSILGHGTNRESFGRVFVEAMMASKPVVTPRGGGAASIVVDGETGLLTDPGDAGELTLGLLKLIDNPGLAARLGAAGAVRAKELFSISAHVRAICGIYDTLPDGSDRT